MLGQVFNLLGACKIQIRKTTNLFFNKRIASLHLSILFNEKLLLVLARYFSTSFFFFFPNHKTTFHRGSDQKMGMWFFKIEAISHIFHHNLLHLLIHPPPLIINSFYTFSIFHSNIMFKENRLTTKLGVTFLVSPYGSQSFSSQYCKGNNFILNVQKCH